MDKPLIEFPLKPSNKHGGLNDCACTVIKNMEVSEGMRFSLASLVHFRFLQRERRIISTTERQRCQIIFYFVHASICTEKEKYE